MANDGVYQIITDRILQALSDGVVPWRKTWADGGAKNLVSKKPYRGVNAVLLGAMPFASPYFLTFKQAKEAGGSVRKGEHGIPVIYFRVMNGRDSEGAEGDTARRWAMMRHYTVFNVEQCDGIKVPVDEARQHAPIEACEGIVASYANGPRLVHRGDAARYTPDLDLVTMPAPESFDAPEGYYSTLFHELGHSTGHIRRLARDGVVNPTRFASHAYSREELVAEMTAAMLCGVAGIAPATIDNSAAYIGSWLSALRNDPRLVIEAASAAQKAADMIRGLSAREDSAHEAVAA